MLSWIVAVTLNFFATLKSEEATEPYATKQQADRAIAQYIHGFYNPIRLHSSLRYLSPYQGPMQLFIVVGYIYLPSTLTEGGAMSAARYT